MYCLLTHSMDEFAPKYSSLVSLTVRHSQQLLLAFDESMVEAQTVMLAMIHSGNIPLSTMLNVIPSDICFNLASLNQINTDANEGHPKAVLDSLVKDVLNVLPPQLQQLFGDIVPHLTVKKNVHIRLSNVPHSNPFFEGHISQIRSVDVGKLMTVKGTVVRSSNVKMMESQVCSIARIQ